MKIFFSGIGGVGMSALASIFKNLGFDVYGSDIKESIVTKQLAKFKIPVFIGQDPANIQKVKPKLLVKTNAIDDNHPEIKEAYRRNIPVLTYPQALGIITNLLPTIGITGTHGKTSTTALVSKILIDAGYDPFALIGALYSEFNNTNFRLSNMASSELALQIKRLLNDFGKVFANITPNTFTKDIFISQKIAKIKNAPYFVFEADEYKDAFLNHTFDYLVIVSVDYDHPDYFKTKEQYFTSFAKAILNTQKAVILDLTSENTKTVLTIAQKLAKQYCTNLPKIIDYSRYKDTVSNFNIYLRTDFLLIDATAAYALGKTLGISDAKLAKSITSYKGVWRRFEIIKPKTNDSPCIISDYAHNPQKIYMAMQALADFMKQNKQKHATIIFEPHTYDRLITFENEFIDAFIRFIRNNKLYELSIVVVVADVYKARGPEIKNPKMDSKKFVRKLRKIVSKRLPDAKVHITYGKSAQNQYEKLKNKEYKSDTILCLSAGKLGYLVEQLREGKAT